MLDTHALVWWTSDPRKLSVRARRAAKANAAKRTLAASAVSLFEISTLIRRGRLSLRIDAEHWFGALRSLPEIVIEPVSAEIAWVAGALGGGFPGDPADRIIAATARVLGARLVTADEALRSSTAVDTLW